MNKIKQVIVMRTLYPDKDGNMTKQLRIGKMIAQGAHASLAFLSEKFNFKDSEQLSKNVTFDIEDKEWFSTGFTKICVRVTDEASLFDIYNMAKSKGLKAQLILDSGLTEFNGVPTYTCCAIGPNDSRKIDEVTGGLKLL